MHKTRLQLKANSQISLRTGFLTLLLMGGHELRSTPRPWSSHCQRMSMLRWLSASSRFYFFNSMSYRNLKPVSIILGQNLSLQYTASPGRATSSAPRACSSESTAQPGLCHVETPAQGLLNNIPNRAEGNLSGGKHQMWLREGGQSGQVAAQRHRAWSGSMSKGTGVSPAPRHREQTFEGQGASSENIHCNNSSLQNYGGFPEKLWFAGEEVGILFYPYLPFVFVLVDNIHVQ